MNAATEAREANKFFSGGKTPGELVDDLTAKMREAALAVASETRGGDAGDISEMQMRSEGIIEAARVALIWGQEASTVGYPREVVTRIIHLAWAVYCSPRAR